VTIRLAIADDHEVVRQGLRMLLDLDDEVEIIGEASNGREAVNVARALHPDVVLMDLLMPVLDGIAATEIIRRELPHVQVIALTSLLDDSSVVDVVRAGAVGYLLKTTHADELRRAIKAAADGQVQLSPAAATRLVREVTAPASSRQLTARESQVLVLLAKGRANKEIARELNIGQQTVKTYVSNILGKLGAQSRTQAALHAVQAGMVSVRELSNM
jgi:two-component system, NarL family, response regulator LiaR